MKKTGRTKSSFKAGMYLLETLTSGMYNDPLSIYREYIQNAADSIDILRSQKKKKTMKIDIELDPFNKRITIHDNGFGIPADIAQKTLSSIGSSDKAHSGLRGFRGIGRLGGIAFSDKAIYRTKAQGENTESIQEWDCKKLKEFLANPNKSSLSIKQLFNQTTAFYQQNRRRTSGSYFEVVLEGVSSFRNHIIDIKKVRDYLSQVTPVPFSPEFSYSEKLNNFLHKNLNHYGKYEIILNGEPVYKPYQDKVRVTTKRYDEIIDVETFILEIEGKAVAFGWYGIRKDLLGAIVRGSGDSGIRVRVGNILVGDSHLLDSCFREARFNSYMVGEIHVDNPDLIPNSRRDDFVDNETKTLFYNAIEREIGLPISKEIRFRSRVNSEIVSRNKSNLATGLKGQESNTSKQTSNQLEYSKNISKEDCLDRIKKNCEGCKKLPNILSLIEK